jgi:hypothetical protein
MARHPVPSTTYKTAMDTCISSSDTVRASHNCKAIPPARAL